MLLTIRTVFFFFLANDEANDEIFHHSHEDSQLTLNGESTLKQL